jgi:hypothetical protein
MRLTSLVLALCFALGCDPNPTDPDGGSCALDVALGRGSDGASFVAFDDGDTVELILGFQGFRMLQLALLADGATANEAEVSAFVTIADTGVELGQRTRETALVAHDGGFVLPSWLLFFNDEAPSRIVGHDAEIECIVRAGGCSGATRVRLRVLDDESCIDPTIVIDASGVDAGAPDAAICEAP